MLPVPTDLEMDDPASHYDSRSLLGDPFTDPDAEPCLRADPEAESVRSHADQTLLPHPTSAAPSRPQTQRLQRRRNHYYYFNGTLVPATPPSASPHQLPPRPIKPSQASPPSRAKSHPPAGHSPSWLLGGASAFADAKRQAWTGERRETRKLQKDHPVGSARPGFTVEIGDDDEGSPGGAGSAAERDGARGSVLGVRRKMERLRGLYRRGEKEVEVSSNLR